MVFKKTQPFNQIGQINSCGRKGKPEQVETFSKEGETWGEGAMVKRLTWK